MSRTSHPTSNKDISQNVRVIRYTALEEKVRNKKKEKGELQILFVRTSSALGCQNRLPDLLEIYITRRVFLALCMYYSFVC